jgi:hypothetical protein
MKHLTVCRTPWTGDRPMAWHLPTHDTRGQTYIFRVWDSNPQSPC